MALLPKENRYAYGLYENANYHIVRAQLADNGRCAHLENHAICDKKILGSELENRECLTSNKMRAKGEFLGRKMCGICISHLYTDLSDDELKQLGEK